MVDQTDRLALDTYAQGEDNWDHTDTVELFDELAIDKGPLADRPASGNYDDQFFYATDQRTLWRWDAGTSDWNAAAGLGANGDPIPGTSYFENVDAGSLNTDEATINHGAVRGRNGERIDAAKFDGADPDARLDNALSAASDGDIIYLENARYDASQTISTRVTLIGTGASNRSSGTRAQNVIWTFDAQCVVVQVHFSQKAVLNKRCSLDRCRGDGTVEANADLCLIKGCALLDVVFDSTTSDGVVDSSTLISVTDNGSNIVGDVS